MAKTADEINKNLDYLFSKIDWGKSALDAEAITIMNEVCSDIKALEKKDG